jgi:hypothetical protein
MELYRVEKSRIPVLVTLTRGEQLSGDMFIQGVAEWHLGPERTADVLNDGRGFFPLALADDSTMLVNKGSVRDVAELSSSRDDWRLVPAWRQQRVALRFGDGTTLAGTVDLELPGDNPRLLDFLNKTDALFLPVLTPEGTRLVNREFIESIRLLD